MKSSHINIVGFKLAVAANVMMMSMMMNMSFETEI
jgi:hypothetical protein